MTEKNDDAASGREDSFLAGLVPQVAERLAERHAENFDAEAGLARFQTWLGAHTEKPASRIDSLKAHRRSWHWQLPLTWLALGGILIGAGIAAAFSPTALIFLLGALLGVLAGGMVCVRYLRSAIAADREPQLRRMQLQLDAIEAAVNLALVTRYAERSEYEHSRTARMKATGGAEGGWPEFSSGTWTPQAGTSTPRSLKTDCVRCGEPVADEDAFCGNCGQPVA
jgi:hypothetical protein